MGENEIPNHWTIPIFSSFQIESIVKKKKNSID